MRHCGDPRNDNDDPVGGAILLHHDSPPGELVGEVAYLIFSRVSRVLLESEVEKDEKSVSGVSSSLVILNKSTFRVSLFHPRPPACRTPARGRLHRETFENF